MKTLFGATLAAALALVTLQALAKLPPPPAPTDAQKQAAEEKKAKDAAAADKADLAAAEDRAVKNYQANMKQEGKPIPKPIPVAAASTPPTGGKPGAEQNTAKASQGSKANTPNASSGGAK